MTDDNGIATETKIESPPVGVDQAGNLVQPPNAFSLDGAPITKHGWTHPTGKTPETINLIALGPTQGDWHALNFKYDVHLPKADETWTCNKGFRTLKTDLLFVMDDMVGEANRSDQYRNDLIESGHPIITSIVDEPVKQTFPGVDLHTYPLIPVLDYYAAYYLGNRGQTNLNGAELQAVRRELSYLHNSIPYMLAYAGAIGVRTINLFGADYDFPGSAIHEADKPCCEYWCGALRMNGVKINRSERTTLLSTNRGLWFYGFGARQPRI